VSQHKPSHPLVIYIPPFFQTGQASQAPLPAFLNSYPSAAINYRWLDPSWTGHPTSHESQPSSPSQWPTPIHDVLFGYSWILKHLAPAGDERRDIYVYGSYLGASLAASLALTESHQDQRMAVRGLLTYNGIYNWTMFLPDHPIHQRKSLADALDDTSNYVEGSFFHYLRDNLPVLFSSPSGLFDPFASPSLFFRDPGLWTPDDFTTSLASSPMTRAIDVLSSGSSASGDNAGSASGTSTEWDLKPPPKSYLTFPPRGSMLKIPEALLLYESPPAVQYAKVTRKRKTTSKAAKKRKILNNFEGQAMELGSFMRRSVEKYEFRDREDSGGADVEAERRVQMRDAGAVEGDGTLGGAGQDIAYAWLQERIGR